MKAVDAIDLMSVKYVWGEHAPIHTEMHPIIEEGELVVMDDQLFVAAPEETNGCQGCELRRQCAPIRKPFTCSTNILKRVGV